MKFLSLFLFSFIPFVLSSSEEESDEWIKLLNLPKRDNTLIANVCQLDAQTVNDFLVNNQNKGLLIVVKKSAGAQQSSDFAQQSAQLLASRNITVCELSIGDQTVSPLGTDSPVVLYLNGKQIPYYGRRSPSALLSYVLKLNTLDMKVITGKLDKIAYDFVPGPKLVGFFMPATPDLAAYEATALKYSPAIPFYLVTDRMVAKHLKLSLVGQINLVKPFEKLAITCPVNPATAQDIETFIEQNKGVVLKYLTEHNIFDPQLQNKNKTSLIAIGDRTSAVGQYFHKILTKSVRNITRENNAILTALANATQTAVPSTEPTDPATDATDATVVATETIAPTVVNLDTIEILWIDPQIFPSINAWMDQIQSQYGLAAGLDVYLGAINSKTNQTVWFDTNLVNKTVDKLSDETNHQLLKDFITSVVNNQTIAELNVSSAQLNVGLTEQSVQSFLKEPQSMVVSEKAQFVLECQVVGQVGDCLWLKDGQNIGFNLARISADYSWRNNNGLGDCSLIVSSAQAGRDDGEWVCEVTGDQTNPTITSTPAIVSVKSVNKTEL